MVVPFCLEAVKLRDESSFSAQLLLNLFDFFPLVGYKELGLYKDCQRWFFQMCIWYSMSRLDPVWSCCEITQACHNSNLVPFDVYFCQQIFYQFHIQ